MKVPYFKPWINEQDQKNIISALQSRWLTNGPILDKFEKKISKFLNVSYAIGVSNATSGLHLILKSLNIEPRDEVIVPTMTFTATSDVVKYCNAKPVLADIDRDSFNISPIDIKKRITKRTKGIIVVHYGGQSCDMDEIISIAMDHNIPVIEDCAHSLGSKYKNQFCGSMGIAGCFSFYPTKIITSGEGGMISTNDLEMSLRTRSLRSHGMSQSPRSREKKSLWYYDVIETGYNYRLDEIRSSLGLSQFSRIQQINKMRIKIAKKYSKFLEKIDGITIPKIQEDRNHIFHLYTIKINKDYHLSRDNLFKHLSKNGIGTSVQYTPLHLLSCNQNKYDITEFLNANAIKDEIISLPIYPTMTEKELEYVVSKLKN